MRFFRIFRTPTYEGSVLLKNHLGQPVGQLDNETKELVFNEMIYNSIKECLHNFMIMGVVGSQLLPEDFVINDTEMQKPVDDEEKELIEMFEKSNPPVEGTVLNEPVVEKNLLSNKSSVTIMDPDDPGQVKNEFPEVQKEPEKLAKEEIPFHSENGGETIVVQRKKR